MPINIDPDTRVLGLIGKPIKHSFSPLMHNAVFAQMDLNYAYLPFEIEENQLAEAVTSIRALGLQGVNVTIPYKEKVIPYLDELSEEAAACRAVNVIYNQNGSLIGYNTDGKGFIRALQEENIAIKGRAVFIGAGGAARSLAYELAREGISEIIFMDVDYDKGAGLAKFIAASKLCDSYAEIMEQDKFGIYSKKADLIVNCSPVGMYPRIELSPVEDLCWVSSETVLCDVIYNPLLTKFLRMGQARGLKTVNGLSMFVYQGVLTLEIMLGIKPPAGFMKEVVRIQLEKRTGIYSS